jgi:hypothetical protein
MKQALALATLFVVSASAQPLRATSCDEVKSDIAKKLEAKGVTSYTLEAVSKDQEVTDGKVVGVCEAGAKKIVYKRGAAAAAPATAEPSKP